jgi:transposase InsO family protein
VAGDARPHTREERPTAHLIRPVEVDDVGEAVGVTGRPVVFHERLDPGRRRQAAGRRVARVAAPGVCFVDDAQWLYAASERSSMAHGLSPTVTRYIQTMSGTGSRILRKKKPTSPSSASGLFLNTAFCAKNVNSATTPIEIRPKAMSNPEGPIRARSAGWLDFYNRQRPHGALGRHPPITRLVGNNLPGSYS